MDFRIRKDADSPDYGDGERSYKVHLQKIRRNLPPDLWRYFSVDFFHDGLIEDIRLSSVTEMTLWCPNIKLAAEPEKHSYLNGLFRCEFEDVVFVQYCKSADTSTNAADVRTTQKICFGYAEIDSLEETIRQSADIRGRQYHSLIIQLRPFGTDLSLVFANLRVRALEPLAFSVICSDPRYHVPMAT
jgi:hypothetical protein